MIKLLNTKKLALYHYEACPFCAVTRRVVDELRLDIELRDIRLDVGHRRELIHEGGKLQVPSLRIEDTNGKVDWLYESSDIIQYLRGSLKKAA